MLTRPVIRYHGGKWKLAPWIISHLPPHRIYVEPFGGAASVLLRKPRVYAEVYNDMDGEVCNLFRVMRDRGQVAELERLLNLTPFSREEFEAAYEVADDPVERARRLIARSFMGFSSASHNKEHRTGFRTKSFRSGTSPAADWANYPGHLGQFAERLRGVCIENRPAIELVQSHDQEGILFYVDPPYPRSTRYGDDCYVYEMTDLDHEDLAGVLKSCAGMVVLSGYDCDLYRRLFDGWEMIRKPWFADGAREREECLWISPLAASAMPREFPRTQSSLLDFCRAANGDTAEVR